jgi:hypothetical protein
MHSIVLTVLVLVLLNEVPLPLILLAVGTLDIGGGWSKGCFGLTFEGLDDFGRGLGILNAEKVERRRPTWTLGSRGMSQEESERLFVWSTLALQR